MTEFEIQADKRFDVCFRLAVYGTRKKMLAAIAADMKRLGGVNISDDLTMGMFSPTPGVYNSGVEEESYSNMFGIMYLNLADVTDEVIAHECAHAAFTREFNIRHYTGTFDDDGHDEQEEFCRYLGKAVFIVKKIIRENFKTAGGRN